MIEPRDEKAFVSNPGKQKCVLVVDDEKAIRCLVERVLENCGYEVIAVESGRKALRELANKRIDLVLTDYRMPDMNAADMLQAQRANSSQKGRLAPVVIMTGRISYQVNPLTDSRIVDVLRKPFDMKSLETTVKSALRA
jgi:CheY-like chemotaxis protein